MTNFNKEVFYSQAKKRWHNAQATLTGIMDGFENVHDIDVANSCDILDDLIKNKLITPNYVMDCGAGIGRISQHVLNKYFSSIDLLEQDKKFVEFCQENFKNQPKIKDIYQDSLQNFQFKKSYDVVWIQWCLEHLTDLDVIAFLQKARKNLKDDGVIVIKGNLMENYEEENYIDIKKGDIIRSFKAFEDIFKKCELKIIATSKIKDWSQDLMPVMSFVLKKN